MTLSCVKNASSSARYIKWRPGKTGLGATPTAMSCVSGSFIPNRWQRNSVSPASWIVQRVLWWGLSDFIFNNFQNCVPCVPNVRKSDDVPKDKIAWKWCHSWRKCWCWRSWKVVGPTSTPLKNQFSGQPGKPWPAMGRRSTRISCSVKWWSLLSDKCRCERILETNREKEGEIWECVNIRGLDETEGKLEEALAWCS